MFDQVQIVFSGGSQNFREIEIFGQAVSDFTLKVKATAGNVSGIEDFVVAVGDINEAPAVDGTPQEQTVAEGATLNYDLPAGLFADPEGR